MGLRSLACLGVLAHVISGVLAWGLLQAPRPALAAQPVPQSASPGTPPVLVLLPPSPAPLPSWVEFYQGRAGYWLAVTATAYSPTDPIDRAYHARKGRWRWITADGVTDVRKWPYGIAVSRDHAGIPDLPYGTEVIVPLEGYAAGHTLIVDDTGGRITTLRRRSGVVHLDLRCRTPAEAIRVAGPTGAWRLSVFVVCPEYQDAR